MIDSDDEKCTACGGELDTGWECTECGHDDRDTYFKPESTAENPHVVPINGDDTDIIPFENQ